MNLIRYVILYIVRRPIKNIILCSILMLIFLGEFIGLRVNSISEKGKEDAYIYNGMALSVSVEDGSMSPDIYNQILNINHVLGVNKSKENIALPIGMSNVKEYVGIDPGKASERDVRRANSIVLVSQVNTEFHDFFRKEEAVSLISGEFPTYQNKGVLIESRFAKQNNLDIGDEITLNVEDMEDNLTFKVSGIYQVNSEFQITEHNDIGEGVFIYSPYNTIFIDYEYSSEKIGFESSLPYACEVFVDYFENVDGVATQLRTLLGEDADIYNNASSYLSNQQSIVVLMSNYAWLIFAFVSVIGTIVMLIVFTYFIHDYKYESGIFIALGTNKSRICVQYFISMLIISSISYGLALLIYSFCADSIINMIGQNAQEIVALQYPDNSYGPYITPNLRNDFVLHFDAKTSISLLSYFQVLGMGILFLVISMIIPIYSLIKSATKDLLSNH